MDILDLDKLMEGANIAEKIASGVVDDTAYNALTQTVNEEVLMESRDEVNNIIKNGRNVRGDVDFSLDQLEADVAALNEAEAPSPVGITGTKQSINSGPEFQEAPAVSQDAFMSKAVKAEKTGDFDDAKKAKLTESISTFQAFVESERTEDNQRLVEYVTRGLNCIKSHLK
jgi:hypothetical protein